jgi:hypothetical protein
LRTILAKATMATLDASPRTAHSWIALLRKLDRLARRVTTLIGRERA